MRREHAIRSSRAELLRVFYGLAETIQLRFDGLEDADTNFMK